MVFAVRTSGDPASALRDLRSAVAAVDRNLPLYNVRTEAQQIDSALTRERLFAQLTTCFGTLALLLASVGLYGVMSYTVARRTGEIGIRMALGAAKGDIARMVLGEVLVLVAIGLGLGLPAALVCMRLIRNQFYGLGLADPVSIAVAIGALAVVAGLAGYLPARRASRIDPMAALRQE
jgi:ABC-type antimicrobial peptide transport system permease subunit